MLQSFFPSRTRVKLLRLFLSNPNRKYYLREIGKLFDEPITPIRRELLNLKKVGFLRRTKTANLIYYVVNPHFLLYRELKSMIEKIDALHRSQRGQRHEKVMTFHRGAKPVRHDENAA